jgi:hypothetical protein
MSTDMGSAALNVSELTFAANTSRPVVLAWLAGICL